MERLNDIGEDALISRLTGAFEPDADVLAGVGEDCAVVESGDPEIFHLYKVDSVVEGIHFRPELEAESAGRKAVNRALSDFAAMGGGNPNVALVNFAAPPDCPVSRAEGFYEGIRDALEIFGVSMVGGETVSLPAGAAPMLSVFVAGEISRHDCRFRTTAKIGDRIAVTGKLGGSFSSGHHHRFAPRIGEAKFLIQSGRVRAMMDISDGLARDLPRLAEASGCGYRIDFDAVPRRDGCDLEAALGDGEDYELLFTFDDSDAPDLVARFNREFPDVGVTVIGEITESVETPVEGGWEHFAKPGA